jgi:predicted esterase
VRDFTHRFIPAGAGGPACTLLLLHGTGGNEDDLLPLGRMLLPGAALLSPRGRVLERGMPRFFRRLAEGVFDLEDLRARAAELAGFVRTAAATYAFDPARVVAVGFSNGANIAASLLLLHPGVLAGAVLFRPMVPLVPERPPDLAGVPVFIAAGRGDPIVPPEEPERLAALLRAAGAVIALHWEAAGHGLAGGEVDAAGVWLAAARGRICGPPPGGAAAGASGAPR